MERFIDAELLNWKESKRRKPLIIRGARQVGKTYSVKFFGATYFENIVFIDLERNPELHQIFHGALDSRRICADIEVILKQKIKPGKSLLFIDEIQSFPRAITALRYFYEEMPNLHVIAAGSLLEFATCDISIPVGRVQFLTLYPLTFAEYLHAIGNKEAAEMLFGKPSVVSPAIHNYLIDELRRYFFIGGMPECVKVWVHSGSMREAFEVQSEIINSYRMDFAKYTPQVNHFCLNTVLTEVSRSVGKQIKYSSLGEGYSNPTLKKAFDLLCLAKVIQKVSSIDPSGLPLGASASAKIFKSLVADIGLMCHLTGMSLDIEYTEQDLLNIYRGALAEQFVGQEMTVSQQDELYYWSRAAKSSTAEVDFVAVVGNNIYPVEVKSGVAGKLKSLHLLLHNYPNCKKGIVFSSQPYSELPEQKLVFLPLYFAFKATGGTGKLKF